MMFGRKWRKESDRKQILKSAEIVFLFSTTSANLKDLLFNEFQDVSLVAGINFHKINAVFELADIVSE